MEDNGIRLDAISEMLALSSVSNTKNLILTALELQGPLDTQAMTRAVGMASHEFPQLGCLLKEARARRKHVLYWENGRDRGVPVTASELDVAHGSEDILSAWLQLMAPSLDKEWDLFNEPPARVEITRISQNHHVFSPILHHAGADAGTAIEFGRSFLGHYHELMTGEKPMWGRDSPAVSTGRKRMVEARDVGIKEFIRNTRVALTPLFRRPLLPIGTGAKVDSRQWHVKRRLSPELTASVAKASAKLRASVVDLLVCVSNRAIDQWNAERDVPPGIITTSVTVNMRGRFKGMESPNNSAVMTLKSTPEERKNQDRYARNVSLERIKQFRRHMDFRYFENVTKLTDSVRVFPFGIRRRIVHALSKRHQYSIGVTFLGIIWPEVENGRVTGNTAFSRTADVDITAIHGIGYKLLSDTHLLLIAYIYKHELNLVLAASGCLFTKPEAEQFMDLVVEALQGHDRP